MSNESTSRTSTSIGASCARRIVGFLLATVFLIGLVLILAITIKMASDLVNGSNQVSGVATSLIFFFWLGCSAYWVKFFRERIFPGVMSRIWPPRAQSQISSG